MADVINNETPEETEESGNTKTVPASPQTSMDKEPTMEDIFSDDEVIITDAEKKRQNLMVRTSSRQIRRSFHWMVEHRINRHHLQLA